MPAGEVDLGTLRLRDHRPEPANLWQRHSLVVQSCEAAAWVDLANGNLMPGASNRASGGRQEMPKDLVYFPPAAADQSQHLEDARTICSAEGIPTLEHSIIGLEPGKQSEPSGGRLVADPLHVLLRGDLECLGEIRNANLVIWPLLPGLTDTEDLVAEGLDRLASAGVLFVVPIVPEIDPGSARAITERYGEDLFAALFHSGVEADPWPVLQAIARAGMDFLPPRPDIRSERFLERRVAAELAMIADLMLILKESPAKAQEFFRAAAWFEATHYDITSMAREGNLELVPVLGAALRPVVEELAQGVERSALLLEYIARVAGGPD